MFRRKYPLWKRYWKTKYSKQNKGKNNPWLVVIDQTLSSATQWWYDGYMNEVYMVTETEYDMTHSSSLMWLLQLAKDRVIDNRYQWWDSVQCRSLNRPISQVVESWLYWSLFTTEGLVIKCHRKGCMFYVYVLSWLQGLNQHHYWKTSRSDLWLTGPSHIILCQFIANKYASRPITMTSKDCTR